MDTEHKEIHEKLDKIIAILDGHIKDRPFKSWKIMGKQTTGIDKLDKIIAILEEHIKE